jgi:hypothetical protein
MRTIFAVLTIASLSSAANAQQWDAFDACATNKDPTARLACFDQAVSARQAGRVAPTATTGAAAGLPPAAIAPRAPAAPITAVPDARPAPAPAGDSDIGLSAEQARKQRAERGEAASPPPPTAFTATIAKVIPRSPLISVFELTNGQVWEQTEAAKFSAEPQQTVSIRRGAFGSFFLKNAAGSSVRVRRLK